MKAFLDTNILLDALVVRANPKFSENAEIILGLGENGALDLYMSVLSIPTIAYVLKNMTADQKKAVIKDLTSIVKVLPSIPEHVSNMLESPIKDIEDALQAESAKEGQCDIIVTRDTSDFRHAGLPIISPDKLIKRILG